jgi:hypothetical protein
MQNLCPCVDVIFGNGGTLKLESPFVWGIFEKNVEAQCPAYEILNQITEYN